MATRTSERARLLVAIPAEIKQAANDRSVNNMTDEIVGVLADHFGIPFVPSEYRRTAGAVEPGAKTLLRMPQRLKDKIVREAVSRRTDQTQVVNSILAERYGVEYESTSTRRSPVGGRRGASPAAA
jgi:hypothetical protein